ncbi:MAG: hypothetical protein HQM13_00835 [SAR324 cluster bacterium]|nr:hypothetical protein [SAR324 cluster bacterium]
MKRPNRLTAIALFVFGIMVLLGGRSYGLLYDEIVTRLTGEGVIDWERLAALCGGASVPYPGESVWDYRLRSTWEMISARMAMTAVSIAFFFSFYKLACFIFWFTEKK